MSTSDPIKQTTFSRAGGIFLLAAVFIVAICGLVYELLAAAMSSYLLGGSITQFSIVIGVFLSAMGIGSYLTRFVEDDMLADAFLGIQIAIGLCGGLSAAILLITFSALPSYTAVLIITLTIIGALVGMEIPLLIRILQNADSLKITVSNVLALDYIGALIASCAFPLIFVPYAGLLRTSYIFGLLNIVVALVGLRILGSMLRNPRRLGIAAGVVGIILCAGLLSSGNFTAWTESMLYQDRIILAVQTPYQRLVVTRWRHDIRLFIDGHLQFSTVDEHRYHECLVHPAFSARPHAKRVLILGGGDGMAAREALKYRSVEQVDLVDIDKEMLRLFTKNPMLSGLSQHAFSDPRMKVHVMDAGKFMEESPEQWDLIFMDLPDPSSLSLGRLYTNAFFKLVATKLNESGILTTQATSPFYAPEAFWSIVKTLGHTPIGPEGDLRLQVYPYHTHIPSFGDWGFIMASKIALNPEKLKPVDGIAMKFLSAELMPTLFIFPKDVAMRDVRVNRPDDQVIAEYYRRAWKRFTP